MPADDRWKAVACAIALVASAASVVCAAPIEAPDSLRKGVLELTSLRSNGNRMGYAARADAVGNQLYEWVIASLARASANEVIAALKAMVRVRTNESALSPAQREAAIESHDAEVVFVAAMWTKDDRQLLAVRVDHRVFTEDRSDYLVSRPPIVIAKDRRGLTLGNFDDCSQPFRFGQDLLTWNVFTFHGFVHGPKGSWPDLLVSRGPEGSGRFVTPIQAHLVTGSPAEWRIVWGAHPDDGDAGGTLRLDERSNLLTMWSSAWTGPLQMRLSHGSAPGGHRGEAVSLPRALCSSSLHLSSRDPMRSLTNRSSRPA
jgi:hypothetical protein